MDDLINFKDKLGRRIAYLRESKGLTQPELASLLNKDFQSISRIENGHVNVSGYTIQLIAIALNVTMNEIYDFSTLKEKYRRKPHR